MAKARAALVVHRNDEILYFNSIELAKHYIDKTTSFDDVSRRTGAVRKAMQIHSDLNKLNDACDEHLHAAIRRSSDFGCSAISKEELRVARKINRKANEAKHCWDLPREASDSGLTSDSTTNPACCTNGSDVNGTLTKHTDLAGVDDTGTRSSFKRERLNTKEGLKKFPDLDLMLNFTDPSDPKLGDVIEATRCVTPAGARLRIVLPVGLRGEIEELDADGDVFATFPGLVELGMGSASCGHCLYRDDACRCFRRGVVPTEPT
eukprot:TRINITY_DN16348_c0_g2_i4.p1 TRINITY_DN16348_c0_g2~~TRINITY_DN16348_c0_g2_i4.p1  ORF type:complete len:290 (+),score=43.72 TRINITY_DN16348_c0_g2_i4:84-872(+)